MIPFNMPPGNSYALRDDAVAQRCKHGHEWAAAMYYELGGWFYRDENQAACPVCGEEALDA